MADKVRLLKNSLPFNGSEMALVSDAATAKAVQKSNPNVPTYYWEGYILFRQNAQLASVVGAEGYQVDSTAHGAIVASPYRKTRAVKEETVSK
jgi:hypothetical protein